MASNCDPTAFGVIGKSETFSYVEAVEICSQTAHIDTLTVGVPSAQLYPPNVQQFILSSGSTTPPFLPATDASIFSLAAAPLLVAPRDGMYLMTCNGVARWADLVTPVPADPATRAVWNFKINGTTYPISTGGLTIQHFVGSTLFVPMAMTWAQNLSAGDTVDVIYNWFGSVPSNANNWQISRFVVNLIAL